MMLAYSLTFLSVLCFARSVKPSGSLSYSFRGSSSASPLHSHTTGLRAQNRLFSSRRLSVLDRVRSISGGASSATVFPQAESFAIKNVTAQGSPPIANVTVLVSVPGPSEFMQRRRSFDLNPNDTVASLKRCIERSFPGQPPVRLQRLFLGTRALSDEDAIGELSDQTRIAVTLDTLCGTNAYNRTMSISEALEALCAIDVHAAANAEALMAVVDGGAKATDPMNLSNGGENETSDSLMPHSLKYRSLFETLNTTLYSAYGSSITSALARETDPVQLTPDTAAWVGPEKEQEHGGQYSVGKVAPVTAWTSIRDRWVYKELGLYSNAVKETAILTLQLVSIAYFVAMTKFSQNLVLLVALGNILSHLRIVRLCAKAITYTVLPYVSQNAFLIGLLSAPYATIMSEYVGELRREGYSVSEPASASGSDASKFALRALKAITDALTRAKSNFRFEILPPDATSSRGNQGRGGGLGSLKRGLASSIKASIKPSASKSAFREAAAAVGRSTTARSILKSRYGKEKKK